ncbi:phage portal protein [Novacetimonas maltaceti]|uniref:Phage portal protein, lambda family n=1 Tax=Novacetimonas maltaceti TaxID=1203393 RepID=A0A2S3W3W3_9PROT|nr:phage portal protein [Novacetimonas maltaceti]POF63559.1 Phage portal protein, lambda family [Novacetimonas maltaceti]PYD59832.1 phage portal protein [Novacetimonas maltaceti]
MAAPFTGAMRQLKAAFRRAFAGAHHHGGTFEGATGGPRAPKSLNGPINPEVMRSLHILRGRSRAAAFDNPWCKNGVGGWVAELVGDGITASPTVLDAASRKAILAYWAAWCQSCDADGRTNWIGIQESVVRALAVDGEAFLQVIRDENGLKLRLIPAEQVYERLTANLPDGGYIVQGIEFAPDGTRRAYHILPIVPTALYATYMEPVRVPASDIIHVVHPLAAGQVRGLPWLSAALIPANEVDQLVDALTVNAKVASMLAGFLVDQSGNGEPIAGNQIGDVLESGLEPGTLTRLPPGYDVRFSTPQQATSGIETVKLSLQAVAAALEMPVFIVTGDLSGANYSSLRAGLMPFRRTASQRHNAVLVPQFLTPVWREVITFGVLSGALDLPGFETDPAYLAVRWLAPKPFQVDPLKSVQADTAEIAAGLKSRRQAVAERGRDVSDLDAEIAHDNAEAAALGLSFTDPATPTQES